MVSKQVMTGFVVAAMLAAGPAAAQDHQRARNREQSAREGQSAPQRQQQPQQRQGNSGDRAVQRQYPAQRSQDQRQYQNGRRSEAPRTYQAPPVEQQRRSESPRVYQQPRGYAQPRVYEQPRVYQQPRGYEQPRVYQQPRGYQQPRYNAPRRDYGIYRGYVPRYNRGPARIIRPSIVTVVPWRPYVYRPSWSLGVYYGSDGYYPYGYTPREYYDPIPGRPYGGLRITDMPRDAQVFADGYYVGIVNDFDGIFQHLNLEAGPHHIEILLPGGYDPPVAFDVYIEPGRTVTYRAGY